MSAHVVHLACDIAAPFATLALGLLIGSERGFRRAWNLSRSAPPLTGTPNE